MDQVFQRSVANGSRHRGANGPGRREGAPRRPAPTVVVCTPNWAWEMRKGNAPFWAGLRACVVDEADMLIAVA